MRFLYAYKYGKKDNDEDPSVPIYRDGVWWAVIGYKVFWRLMEVTMDIAHFFLRFTCEHHSVSGNTRSKAIKCNDCGRKLSNKI